MFHDFLWTNTKSDKCNNIHRHIPAPHTHTPAHTQTQTWHVNLQMYSVLIIGHSVPSQLAFLLSSTAEERWRSSDSPTFDKLHSNREKPFLNSCAVCQSSLCVCVCVIVWKTVNFMMKPTCYLKQLISHFTLVKWCLTNVFMYSF